MAQNFQQFDDRQGNAYTVADVIHLTGTASTFSVDQSAISVCHSPTAGQTALNLSTELTMAAAGSGVRVVTVASGAASGTYTVVVRHSGSAAGIGSFKP